MSEKKNNNYKQMTNWNYQYLKEEQLHYLTEEDEQGIVTEIFPHDINSVYDYINKNDITLTEFSQGKLEVQRLRMEYVITPEEILLYKKQQKKKMNKKVYQIRKTILEKKISVLMNDSLGVVLEFNNFDDVSKMCEILNSNTDSNCKYEIQIIKQKESI